MLKNETKADNKTYSKVGIAMRERNFRKLLSFLDELQKTDKNTAARVKTFLNTADESRTLERISYSATDIFVYRAIVHEKIDWAISLPERKFIENFLSDYCARDMEYIIITRETGYEYAKIRHKNENDIDKIFYITDFGIGSNK